MAEDFIPLEEAVRLSGYHPNSLKRVVREGKVSGELRLVEGKWRLYLSLRSLQRYTDPEHGFALERPGPKMFLKRSQDRR